MYESAVDGMAAGTIQFALDSFKVMLVSDYVPDKIGHSSRADVAGEVSGTGYTAGGAAVDVAVTTDIADRTDIGLGGANWPVSTISATGAVYYASPGDELVCYVDFGSRVVSVAGLFSLSASTISIHNP